jgi:lysophospholipase L1-like esterase
MKQYKLFILVAGLSILSVCSSAKYFTADNPSIQYSGRIDFMNPKEPVFIGSASFAEVKFAGDSCSVLLKKLNRRGEYNFVSLELDGKNIGRLKLIADSMAAYPVVPSGKAKNHILRIYKATEAQNGNVVFGGINCNKLVKLSQIPKRKMEFIGNSITCGMGIEWKEIPCNTGQWYDQHNGSLAYGPLSAKALNAQFILSSVSGIGIYRNWNSLHPVMPEVYENKYLNTDTTKRWIFSIYTPDLVSICLGTNDFSDGDGRGKRAPFDSATYVSEYIKFVNIIYSHYPKTQICLLTSPMVNGEKAALFERCLSAVKSHFRESERGKKEIAVYFFKSLIPHGCDSHPDKEDHQKMAEMLIPFYKEVMGWK